MNRKWFMTRMIGYPMAVLLLVACGTSEPAPTATLQPAPEPTATSAVVPTEAAEEWSYVALGDSEAACCGERSYPEYFAEFIEQDLNVKVALHNLAVGGLDSAGLLKRLDTEYYRSLISKARVVTIVITMEDLLVCPQGDKECAEDRLATARANYTAILEEILSLTGAKDTIIRAQTYDNPFVNRWKAQGVFEERSMVSRLNQQIVEIASQFGIPVADVYQDFNGPNGDEDPGDKGYVHTDDFHNNDAGVLRMAELLRELGYDPLDRE